MEEANPVTENSNPEPPAALDAELYRDSMSTWGAALLTLVVIVAAAFALYEYVVYQYLP